MNQKELTKTFFDDFKLKTALVSIVCMLIYQRFKGQLHLKCSDFGEYPNINTSYCDVIYHLLFDELYPKYFVRYKNVVRCGGQL